MADRAPPQPTVERARETENLIARKSTDVARWASLGNLATQWDARAAMAAEWIPDGVRVLDVGCGAMALGGLLKSDCSYFPADVVERGPGAFVTDLNKHEFPPGLYDWVSFLGVLEYVHDVTWALRQAHATAEHLLVTYCTHVGGDIAARRGMGWVNDLTQDQLVALLADAGWLVERAEPFKRSATNIQVMFAARHMAGTGSDRP